MVKFSSLRRHRLGCCVVRRSARWQRARRHSGDIKYTSTNIAMVSKNKYKVYSISNLASPYHSLLEQNEIHFPRKQRTLVLLV